MALSAHRISLDYCSEDIDSMTTQMENLKLEKAKAKSNLKSKIKFSRKFLNLQYVSK